MHIPRLVLLAIIVLAACADTATHRTPADNAVHGDPFATGDPANRGDTNPGDPASGDASAGDPSSGDTSGGDTNAGDPDPGDTNAGGDTAAGDSTIGGDGADPYQGRPTGQCTENSDCRPNGLGTLTCRREPPGGLCEVCAGDNCPDMNACNFGACVSQCVDDEDCPPGRYCGGTSLCLIQACTGGVCPTPLFACSSIDRCERASCAGGEICPLHTTCINGLCIEDRALQ